MKSKLHFSLLTPPPPSPETKQKITHTNAVHPVINVRNQLVGSPFEKDVTIECNVEASPKSINYWIKDVKDGK